MRENVCELSLPSWSPWLSSSSSPSPSPLSSSLKNSGFLLLGKSIEIREQQQRQQQRSLQKTTSHNKTLINDINENPMRHIKRIRQLFLPVCEHKFKHEIANHYRDMKNKKATKEARAKAKLYRQQQQQHQQQLQELRKKATFAKLVSTAIVHRRRTPSSIHHHPRQSIRSPQRHVLQIPSFPRAISHESTVNVRKGRQTLCNLRQPNDLYIAAQGSGKNPLATNNRLIQKGQRKDLTQLFTSFESSNAKASPIKPNLLQSFDSSNWQTCCCHSRRRYYYRFQKSQRQTCIKNQPNAQVGASNTEATTAPNCNYFWPQQRKTYRSRSDTSKNNKNTHSNCDENRDCINNIDTNKTEWYIELASNRYRNGFQLHVNHLDEWSKHPCLLQKKPTKVLSFLRLPSSAQTRSVTNEKTCVSHDRPISTVSDLIVDSSIITQQPSFQVACERINPNNKDVLNDCKAQKNRLPHQLNDCDDVERIYVENSLKPSDTHHSNQLIDESSKLPIIDTERIVEQRQHQPDEHVQCIDQIKRFDTPNAKNTMNSVAIDANIHLQQTTNCHFSCQTIRNNYRNNNLAFDREFHAGAKQTEPHTIVFEDSIAATAVVAATAISTATAASSASAVATNITDTVLNNNSNNHHHQHRWFNENNSDAIVSTNSQSIETRPTATNDIDIDDLIESFNVSFDVTDPTQRHKLPQIVLTDFSNNQLSTQPSPPPTPLAFAIQSMHTLSEQPDQLQELQHFFHQTANTQ